MKIIKSFSSLLVLLLSVNVQAVSFIADYVPNPKVVGEARLTYLLWDIYDAILFAPQGDWQVNKPFALKLQYLRKIEGKKIADRTMQEMRNQGIDDEFKLAAWHTQLRDIFPDVDQGSVLVGIQTTEGNTIFYHNNQSIGTINSVDFSQAFFNIWLSKKTSYPDLRLKLLGVQ